MSRISAWFGLLGMVVGIAIFILSLVYGMSGPRHHQDYEGWVHQLQFAVWVEVIGLAFFSGKLKVMWGVTFVVLVFVVEAHVAARLVWRGDSYTKQSLAVAGFAGWCWLAELVQRLGGPSRISGDLH